PRDVTSPKTAVQADVGDRFLFEENESRRVRLPIYKEQPAAPTPSGEVDVKPTVPPAGENLDVPKAPAVKAGTGSGEDVHLESPVPKGGSAGAWSTGIGIFNLLLFLGRLIPDP